MKAGILILLSALGLIFLPKLESATSSGHPHHSEESDQFPEVEQDANPAAPHGEDSHPAFASESNPDAAWHAVSPMDKAAFYHEQGDYSLAERSYIRVLESDAKPKVKQTALIQLAEVYRDRGVVAKAVDTLQSCLRNYPDISEKPELLFKLGEYYRELGLKEESVAMFYRVLNSIVVTGETNLDRYMGLARLAQFEIARIHFESEDYDRAYMLFDRVDLLEMNPVDRETVSYYKTLSALKSGHFEEGLTYLEQFEDNFEQSHYLPEILFLKAECLYRLKKVEASSAALHRLLETVGTPDKDASDEWTFWRQQAGNRLANRFYGEENYLVALRIYQGMVSLDKDPSWQLPVIYQIGLCFEKLKMLNRARESYQFIEESISGMDPEKISKSMENLSENARWRLQVLIWREQITEQVDQPVADNQRQSEKGNSET